MKSLNILLEYIDEYVYLQEDEAIVIRYGERSPEAQKSYNSALEIVGDDAELKWFFDIALDCVRKLSDADREYIKNNMNTSTYHMELAMKIRNQYIYSAEKHSPWDADWISSCVMKCIFSILSPFYDFRNRRCVNFYEDSYVQQLSELYGESHAYIFDEFANKVISEGEDFNTETDVRCLKETLKATLGKDEFIRIFKDAYRYFKTKEKNNNREDWYWNTHFPGVCAVLFQLESKQIKALRNLNYFWYIESGAAKNLVECRKFIDENLGLRDDYADFMARCFWEACSPYYNGTWRELSLYNLKLSYEVRSKLETNMTTIGALCQTTHEELMEIQGITEEDALEIEDALKNWLRERNLSTVE